VPVWKNCPAATISSPLRDSSLPTRAEAQPFKMIAEAQRAMSGNIFMSNKFYGPTRARKNSWGALVTAAVKLKTPFVLTILVRALQSVKLVETSTV